MRKRRLLWWIMKLMLRNTDIMEQEQQEQEEEEQEQTAMVDNDMYDSVVDICMDKCFQ